MSVETLQRRLGARLARHFPSCGEKSSRLSGAAGWATKQRAGGAAHRPASPSRAANAASSRAGVFSASYPRLYAFGRRGCSTGPAAGVPADFPPPFLRVRYPVLHDLVAACESGGSAAAAVVRVTEPEPPRGGGGPGGQRYYFTAFETHSELWDELRERHDRFMPCRLDEVILNDRPRVLFFDLDGSLAFAGSAGTKAIELLTVVVHWFFGIQSDGLFSPTVIRAPYSVRKFSAHVLYPYIQFSDFGQQQRYLALFLALVRALYCREEVEKCLESPFPGELAPPTAPALREDFVLIADGALSSESRLAGLAAARRAPLQPPPKFPLLFSLVDAQLYRQNASLRCPLTCKVGTRGYLPSSQLRVTARTRAENPLHVFVTYCDAALRLPLPPLARVAAADDVQRALEGAPRPTLGSAAGFRAGPVATLPRAASTLRGRAAGGPAARPAAGHRLLPPEEAARIFASLAEAAEAGDAASTLALALQLLSPARADAWSSWFCAAGAAAGAMCAVAEAEAQQLVLDSFLRWAMTSPKFDLEENLDVILRSFDRTLRGVPILTVVSLLDYVAMDYPNLKIKRIQQLCSEDTGCFDALRSEDLPAESLGSAIPPTADGEAPCLGPNPTSQRGTSAQIANATSERIASCQAAPRSL